MLRHSLALGDSGGRCSFLAGGSGHLTFAIEGIPGNRVFRYLGCDDNALRELRAERVLLQTCFPSLPEIDEIHIPGTQFAVMEMGFLRPVSQHPAEVLELQRACQSRIVHGGVGHLFPPDRDISSFVKQASGAIRYFEARSLVSNSVAQQCEALLTDLEIHLANASRVPCHGDVSPRNILGDDCTRHVALDWEDRFWGVRDYDYLYWLTFMGNQHYLTVENIQSAQLPRRISVAILVMIVIVKEYIFLSNSLGGEARVSPSERIGRMLSLLP